MTLREAEIDRLMRAANRGDARAYRNLLRLLAPILCGSAQHAFLRQGTSTEDVEDIVRETRLANALEAA